MVNRPFKVFLKTTTSRNPLGVVGINGLYTRRCFVTFQAFGRAWNWEEGKAPPPPTPPFLSLSSLFFSRTESQSTGCDISNIDKGDEKTHARGSIFTTLKCSIWSWNTTSSVWWCKKWCFDFLIHTLFRVLVRPRFHKSFYLQIPQ